MAGVLLGLWLHSGASSAGLNAAFISVTALGMLVGNIAAAAFVDRVARKTTLLWALSLVAVSSLLSAILPFSMAALRSEARRVGNVCVSSCRLGWAQVH